LELRAPGASTTDADDVRSKVLGGQIFSTFNERERKEIWARLERVDGLIPSLHSFFRDIDYLEDCVNCVNCVKRLGHVPRGVANTISSYLRRKLQHVPARDCQVIVQIAENRFITVPGTRADRVDLHVRQLYAFAMRHYLDMPPESQKENLVAKPKVRADPAVLRRFADLAARLGFKLRE
jgi:hypothetical protein